VQSNSIVPNLTPEDKRLSRRKSGSKGGGFIKKKKKEKKIIVENDKGGGGHSPFDRYGEATATGGYSKKEAVPVGSSKGDAGPSDP